jgi:hypothetical protein
MFPGSNSTASKKSAKAGNKLPLKCQALSEILMLKTQRPYSSGNYLVQEHGISNIDEKNIPLSS